MSGPIVLYKLLSDAGWVLCNTQWSDPARAISFVVENDYVAPDSPSPIAVVRADTDEVYAVVYLDDASKAVMVRLIAGDEREVAVFNEAGFLVWVHKRRQRRAVR